MSCPNKNSTLWKDLLSLNNNSQYATYEYYTHIEKLRAVGLLSKDKINTKYGWGFTIPKITTEKSISKGEFAKDPSKLNRLNNYIKEYNIDFLSVKELPKSYIVYVLPYTGMSDKEVLEMYKELDVVPITSEEDIEEYEVSSSERAIPLDNTSEEVLKKAKQEMGKEGIQLTINDVIDPTTSEMFSKFDTLFPDWRNLSNQDKQDFIILYNKGYIPANCGI